MPAQTVIKFRRDTAANWTSTDPTLAAGEAGFETDTNKLKIGDGSTAWSSLPYTGADVTSLDYLGFDTSAAHTFGTADVAWDADAETVAVGLDGVVTARIGQDLYIRVKNASGTTAIPVGTLVEFAGAAGDTVTAQPATTDGSVDHHYMIGITAEEIAADGFGFVALNGIVGGLNTSAWAAGTILYPDPTTAGNLTSTEPTAPNLKMPVAAVVFQGSGTSGKILVRMHVGEELSELHDVQITTPANGQVLQYDGTKWVNAAAAAGGETISSFLLMGA